MYKYIRNIGAHCGAPEIEYMPVKNSTTIREGCVCQMSHGYLENGVDYTKAKFITIESKKANDGKTAIACIRTSPTMMFEVKFIGDDENATAGCTAGPIMSSDGCYDSCDDSEGALEIVDGSEYSKTGKIIVHFMI